MIDEQLAAAVREIGAEISPVHAVRTNRVYAGLHDQPPYPDVVVDRDLAYGSHERHRLDVFRSPGTAGAPVVVFVHGGNFVAGDKHSPGSPFYDNVGVWAARQGFVGVTINYRLAPEHRHPSGIEDLAAVMAWLGRHIGEAGGDARHIVLAGASAGATHVALYLASPERGPVAGAVLMSGRYDFTDLAGDAVLLRYFGEDADLGPLSPLAGLCDSGVPILPVVAEFDPVDHQRQFLTLVSALTDRPDGHGRLPALVRLPRHNHFSEITHLGTEDDSLSQHLADFISHPR